jgi:hypothetical protein
MTSVCIVTTLLAPLQETMMFVNYHLNIGVDQMYLFFDDPADPAAEALADKKHVTCIRCDSDYWGGITSTSTQSINERQRLNAGVALVWARQFGIDWIIHIDSDELIYAEKPLHELLAEWPANLQVMKFATMEAVVDKYEYDRVFEEISLFKVHPGVVGKKLFVSLDERLRLSSKRQGFRRKVRMARLLGCTSISEDAYLRGHILGKSAVRTNANLDGLTCHEPVPGPGEELRATVAESAWLLHFECRGFESWQGKWLKLHSIRLELASHRRRLIDRFMTVYESNDVSGLSALYRRMYFLSSYERFILRRLGLLRRLQLDARLFKYDR